MSMMMKNKVIAVVGATASGKTDYAINLAKKIDGEIISADSRLVYKDMNIGTAKPTDCEMQGVPHYMINVVEPTVEYSAGLYVSDAKKYIEDILKRGKTPIVAGGTGLYFRLLLENYNIPLVKPNKKLRDELNTKSFEELYSILKKLDFEAALSVELNDKKKIIRYIEIVSSTGLPLSKSRGTKDCEYEVDWIGLNFSRDILYERINQRVDFMIKSGLVDEARFLLKKYGKVPNITDTIGYREIISYLDGVCSLDEAINKLKQNTRNYAKRQLTWFRKNELIKWNYYPEKLKK